jgi:three-Cys-motif partner protein
MTTVNGPVDEVGRWALCKLSFLRHYLGAYTTIMKEQNRWCRGYHYVDANAGSGRPKLRDEEVYIDGSPRVALSIKHPFTSYTFIEQVPWRLQRLEALRGEFPRTSIRIVQGDCNAILVSDITPRITHDNYHRAVVFLDPFRMNLEWSTVEAIARTRAIEIFVNVPTMAINREALLNDPTKITPEKIECMNRFWGTEDWRESIYEEVPTLFDEIIERKICKTTWKRLGTLYRERLASVFPFVTAPVPVYNTTGQPIYCLVFAGPNETGGKIATDLMRKMAQ